MTARGWCFTYFGNDEPIFDDEKMKYLVYQREETKDGKLHWQGYIQWRSACRMSAIVKAIGKGCHVEVQRGSSAQAKDYCCKIESRVTDPKEFGVCDMQGVKANTEDVCKALIEGKKLSEVAVENPAIYVRNYRGLEKLKMLSLKDRDYVTECYIIWGASGVGKTRSVHDKEKDLFVKSSGPWWDGYEGQEAVLFDDVNWYAMNDYMCFEDWLKLIDRYPHQVPIKGGYVKFVTKRVYLTSMSDPTSWASREGIKRRVTNVTMLSQSGL